MKMDKYSKILILGSTGLVGKALARILKDEGYQDISGVGSKECDLRDPIQTRNLFAAVKPDFVFMAAGKVGGINANSRLPVDFLYDNVMMGMNVIRFSSEMGASKLLYYGSSCIYPRIAEQPIKEDALLTGPLEPTNEPYAIAKIACLKYIEAMRKQFESPFISCMPTNLFGPGDNYDYETSHVLPALIRKIHDAKVNNQSTFTVWGTGTAKREFLYSEDLARASIILMNQYDSDETINIGSGSDISIKDLANTIAEVVDYKGSIVYDSSKPDGTPRKWLDSSKIAQLGWKPRVEFKEGILRAYRDMLLRISNNTL
jgi:GDP-L-fucose synthase